MYAWIWQKLPGPTKVKALLALLMVVVLLALLFEVVYPTVGPMLPGSTAGAQLVE